MVPVIAFYAGSPEKVHEKALAHLALTHPGRKMETAGSLLIDLLLRLYNGRPLKAAILDSLGAQNNPLLGFPFLKWLGDSDDRVIGSRLSTACYVEDSVPAVIYLALKYHQDPQQALIVNTNLGGDNAARGSILGALLGAGHGSRAFPKRWVTGLLEPLPDIIPP
jgi:ADP-ribosylglycohydrolase